MYTLSKLNQSTGLYEFKGIYDDPDLLARKMRNMMPEDRNLYNIGDPHSSLSGDRWLERYLRIKSIEED